MKDVWTGDAVKLMHVYGITSLQLAEKLGWNPKYLSSVLNCKRRPKNAEITVLSTLMEMIAET